MGLSELMATYGRNYWEALLSTWGMTAFCFALVMALAVVVTVMRVSPFKPLRLLGDGYVQVFRNIPGVALLIIIVYALPSLKLVLPYRTCVILTVVLVASAFGSENFMTGINTIGVGQIEAARSLGLSFGQMLRRIVIPQALRTTVLPMTNLLIAVLLTTSMVRRSRSIPLSSPAWFPISTRVRPAASWPLPFRLPATRSPRWSSRSWAIESTGR